MKRFIALFSLLLLLGACGEDATETVDVKLEEGENFGIEGSVDGAGGMTATLQELVQGSINEIGSTTVAEDGSFTMTGSIEHFGIYQLNLGTGGDKIIPLTLVPGDKIKISSTLDEFTTAPKVSGSEWAETMTEYMILFNKFHDGQEDLLNKQDQMSQEALTEMFFDLKRPVDEFAAAEMKKNPANPFNIVLSGSLTPGMGFDNWDENNLEILKSVSDAYTSEYSGAPIATNLSNQVYQIEVSYNEYQANTSGTRPAPEISLPNPDGQVMNLSDLRGKVVLIDFWASWCGPCRKENPNVVRLYNEYKDQGFTVFSVSLDENKEAWKAAIEADGLVWPNHVSDLKRWESNMPQLYGFSGIPYTVLVNPEGKIIGVGLRGASLEQKLKSIFEKS